MNQNAERWWRTCGLCPRGAWILFFGTFLNKFGTFVLPFLAIYMGRLGYSAAQSGLAIAGYGVGTLAASLLGRLLADRLGRRKTIVLSMFSSVSRCSPVPGAEPVGIIAMATLAGLTGELYRPASSALLADLVPSGQRVTAYAAYRLAFQRGVGFRSRHGRPAGPAFVFMVVHWRRVDPRCSMAWSPGSRCLPG